MIHHLNRSCIYVVSHIYSTIYLIYKHVAKHIQLYKRVFSPFSCKYATDTWDRYFHENVRDATKQMSHNALSADLQILIQKLKSGTRARKKALAMRRDLVSIFHKIN